MITASHRWVPAPARRRPAAAIGAVSARPIVHRWQQQIAAAFGEMVEPPDRVVAACLARAEADRVRHFEVIGALRQGLLNGATTTLDAARTLTEEADRYVQAMLQIALDETTHKRGAPSGRFAVLGVGKLGGCELSLSSDLDVIFVYEALEGGYDVAAADYFNRVSQRLIALLSWAPAWRGSYDIDVRLRPHGEDGLGRRRLRRSCALGSRDDRRCSGLTLGDRERARLPRSDRHGLAVGFDGGSRFDGRAFDLLLDRRGFLASGREQAHDLDGLA